MTSINYVTLIKSAKRAARDVLRTEKVQALLGYIANVEKKIESLRESVEASAKRLARSEYNLRIAQQFQSPDLEETTKEVEEHRAQHAEFAENCSKEITSLEEKIAEYYTKIENWHNGTSKVDLERQNAMAIKFVADKIGTDFNMGAYNEALKEVN